MANISSLVKTTNAYKIVKGDKAGGRLSHAYLFITADGEYLADYLKEFAKLVTCRETDACRICRSCRLIEKGEYADVYNFPANGESITVDDVNLLIEESYVKPVECEKKIFVINHAETMSAVVQNKLLKTLEEPPANVYILMGATGDFSILQTVKSRVKKLEINGYSDQTLYDSLIKEYTDKDKLRNAISCGDGTVGRAIALYESDKLSTITDLATDVIVNMKSSRDVLKFSDKIAASKTDLNELLSVMELLFRDMLVRTVGKEDSIKNVEASKTLKTAQGYTLGAIIYALDKINEAYKRKKFNVGDGMLTEWLLFQILEGKFKWQKS